MTTFLNLYTPECDCVLFLVLLVLRDIYTHVKCVYGFCNVTLATPSGARRIILELLKLENVRRWVTCDMLFSLCTCIDKTKRSRSSIEGNAPGLGGGYKYNANK